MNFETLPDEYERRASNADFIDEPVEQIMLYVKERIRREKAKNRRRDVLAISGATVSLLLFRTVEQWWACLGLGLVIAGAILLEICYLKYRYLGEKRRFDLPRRDFLSAERENILAELRLIDRYVIPAGTVILSGMLLYTAGLMKSASAYSALAGVLTASTLLACLAVILRFNRNLRLTLGEVVQELAEYQPQSP